MALYVLGALRQGTLSNLSMIMIITTPLISSLVAQLVKNLLAMQETPVQFLGVKIHQRRDRLPTPVFLCFPCGSAGKESACNVDSIHGLGRSRGEGKG